MLDGEKVAIYSGAAFTYLYKVTGLFFIIYGCYN